MEQRSSADVRPPRREHASRHAAPPRRSGLGTLLTEAQQVLGVDTVAVLILDDSGTRLVSKATIGLEEELRQGFQLPVGAGFAGRVAASRAPVILDRVEPGAVVNPILLDKGLRSMLGVPLIAGEDLVGVLHVGTRTPRHFTDEDVAALGGVAEEIALAIAAERALDDRSAAEILQRSLLPTRLPVLPGLEFAARFVPAGTSGLGGDWYDAFALPSGRLGVVMGDVAGHGLRAAVVMGRLRSVLRAYAFEGHAPAAALALLDRKFAHFEPDEMATILYAELDPGADRLVLASAGHPLPLSAADEAPATFLDVEVGPPIGTHVEIARTQADHRFTPGTMLAFYTDGLFERRHQPIDSSLERLRRAVRPGPAELSASVVMAEMIGADVLEDDTALLVVRRVAPT